ncbi:poly alpha-glucosyltransferase [Acinetobacter sp. AOR15_HL]|uniref:poly alpha-glucosyltransferase n=1 Tax=unclassified Acinetobacter TaxID=196816 RepID=UPI0022EA18B6|nr:MULTISPECIES: poly alpha-glucosyltransferase [unclassified Acinetobacter]MDA3555945.1 poly alpha-glucosyltransferase [Acinetobacter sp. AOR15_HL]MDA3573201.1 poly alpha-glucosyltransferase [Acinetobacter sp. AOR14_HL]
MLHQLKYLDLSNLKNQISEWISLYDQTDSDKKIVFISYGCLDQRCKVFSIASTDIKKLQKKINNFLEKIFLKDKRYLAYIKLDIATQIEKKSWIDVTNDISNQKHNNHFRKGISFDKDFNICFLEQEIYGNAIIRGISYDQKNFIDQNNLNNAIKKKYPSIQKELEINKIKDVWLFETESVFYENSKFIKLQSGGCKNGVRFIDKNDKSHIKEIINKNANFLSYQLLEDGKFIYGYFPAFDNEIKSYNTIRHCTSIYSLLETFEIEDNNQYWPKIHLAIEYSIKNFYKLIDEDTAHMIDGNDNNYEIKLGANAAAILMLTKYQEITKNKKYLEYAEKIANGIIQMIDKSGQTVHILEYPSLSIKEKFRIVYYDGEAALALLRLYQLNNNKLLLDTVKLMFDNFISNSYEKYHDHWLSYCTNELTMLCPEFKYYQFGINNYLKHMDFIKNRKTAYATFLEMMMSAYKMVSRLSEQGHEKLFNSSRFEDLKSLIKLRAEFQRTGFFYPEVAMYMKNPKSVLNSFYVRHDRFRTRIDDQEHNLSGYIAYYLYFKD